MLAEQIELFVDSLVKKTKKRKLHWKPFALLIEKDKQKWEKCINTKSLSLDFIRIPKSYYLQSGEGYVFLFDISSDACKGVSQEKDRITLMVKVNEELSMYDLSGYCRDEQNMFRTLQSHIEKYCDPKYDYPDALYSFFQQVIGDDDIE